MEQDNRAEAMESLINLAEKQGYLTFDDILDGADEYDLSIQLFDVITNHLVGRNIIIYEEDPPPQKSKAKKKVHSRNKSKDEGAFQIPSRTDYYEDIYQQIIELDDSLEPFINELRAIPPPQRREMTTLKKQVLENNKHARDRMVEMHLRVAVRYALKAAPKYDLDIGEAIGDACVGLAAAVDQLNSDTISSFRKFMHFQIRKNIMRGQTIKRPLVHYPPHRIELGRPAYSVLKERGCINCGEWHECKKDRDIVQKVLKTNDENLVKDALEMFMPLESLEQLLEEYQNAEENNLPSVLANWENSVRLQSDVIESIDHTIECEELHNAIERMLDTLEPRERAVILYRYGFDGGVFRTLEEVGRCYNVTRERVRQIEKKALKKLRSPTVARMIIDFVVLSPEQKREI